MSSIKDFCEEAQDCFDSITVYRKDKKISVWINTYFLRDFHKALTYCLGTSIFDDGGIECSLQFDTLYIEDFQDIVNQYDINGYQKFINCMKNRMDINYY